MKAIDVPELVKSLGFEELASMGREEMITDFLPACITGFADGDLYAMHEPYSGEQADLYGEGHYSEGRVAKVVLEAALANRMDPGPLYDFQGFVAEIFTDPKSLYATQTQATTNSVRIHPEAVVVDDNIVTLDQKPALTELKMRPRLLLMASGHTARLPKSLILSSVPVRNTLRKKI